MDADLTIDADFDGKGTRATITVRLDGDAIAVDKLDLAKSAERARFTEDLCSRYPALDPEAVEQNLIELAARQTQRADRGDPANTQNPEEHTRRPEVMLPGGPVTVSECAERLGTLLAATGEYFTRGGAVVQLMQQEGRLTLQFVKPAALPSVFESVARLRRLNRGGDAPDTCSEQSAKLILNADPFVRCLPEIRVLSQCPVLIEQDGELRQITGYDAESGVLAAGSHVPKISLEEAQQRLNELIQGFAFASPADRSRALASLLTPALIFGDLLKGRAPVDLTEADRSQAGKGYRNKLNAAVYGQKVRCVVQKKGGVGSQEESFNSLLVAGASMISLDNVRGRIDSPAIESFLTEDAYSARIPYSGNIEIDPRRVIVMMTSNRAELTEDFANRSSCVRIRKQPEGYPYATYPEGDLLDHVRAHPSYYLAAVFAVIEAWHAAGKRRSDETRHDFRKWAQTLDWIVHNLLGEAPLIDGHQQVQERMSNPAHSWLRDLAHGVIRSDRLDCWLRANDLLQIAIDDEIEVPGLADGDDAEDESVRKNVLCAIGRRLRQCFRDGETVRIDGLRIERRSYTDDAARSIRAYRFPRIDPPSSRAENGVSANVPHTPHGSEHSDATPSEGMGENCGGKSFVCQHGGDGGQCGNRTSVAGTNAETAATTLTDHEREMLGGLSARGIRTVEVIKAGLARVGGAEVVSARPLGTNPRDLAAMLIRDARGRGDHALGLALRDAWRDRMAICLADDVSLEIAETVAVEELQNILGTSRAGRYCANGSPGSKEQENM